MAASFNRKMEAISEKEANLGGQQECDKLLCDCDPGEGTGSNSSDKQNKGYPTKNMELESDASKTKHVGLASSENSTGSDQSSTPHKQATAEIHSPLKLDVKASQEFDKVKSCPKKKFLKVAVTVMFIMITVGVIVIWTFHGTLGENTVAKYFAFNEKSLILTVWSMSDVVSLEGRLGGDKFLKEDTDEPVECSILSESPDRFDIKCDNEASLTLSKIDYDEFICLNISWINISPKEVGPMDCFELKYGRWYGMLNKVADIWPISGLSIPLSPYVPGHNDVISNIVDFYWLSSRAVTVYVPKHVPLVVSWNSTDSLCLSVETFLGDDKRDTVGYSYALCQGEDMKTSHELTREHLLPFNRSIFHNTVLDNPFIWVYGVTEKRSNLTELREFIQNIKENNLRCLALIDMGLRWEDERGDLDMDPKLVTDIDDLILRLEKMNCGLVLPISPVCSYRSPCFRYGIENDMFINDVSTGASKLVNWQGQEVAVWDLTNPATVSYIKEKLLNLTTQHRISFFRLLPLHGLVLVSGYNNSVSFFNQVSEWWTDVLQSLSSFVLLQEPFRSQDKSVIVELSTTEENVDEKVCYKNIIPTALTTALYGYPYFVVGMSDNSKVDQEVFIRWLQLSIFLPFLKIPDYVFQYDIEVIQYMKDMLRVRNSIIEEVMSEGISEGYSDIFPNIRPLWWWDPNDATAQSIDSEFMLGDKYLIAPVLCSGSRSRDIYFPNGDWMTPDGTEEFIGKKWVKDYPVSLYTVPYFKVKPQQVIKDL